MNPLLIKNFNASAAIDANLLVKLASDTTVAKATAASDFIIGASTFVPVDSGEPCDVIHAGIAMVKAGGGITRGQFVTANADGKAVYAVDGDRAAGMALADAVADDLFPVLIIPCGFAGASVAGTDAHAIHDNPGAAQTIAGSYALIHAGGFTGPLTGNVTGNVSGTAGGLKDAVTDVAASGAISVKTGLVTISKADDPAELTIADPATPADDGKRLTILSLTAKAHTVSNAAGSGFNGGGAASDIATFGAAIGNSMEIVAIGGKWYVLRLTNVTLG